MIEKRVVSYGYIPEAKVMMTRPENQNESIITYSQFDENYLNKQPNKANAKRNARRRVEKSRNVLRGSDAESDTSDGFTVNSGGSGRSGDWGPPKLRQKPKYSRKRYEQRASFTDSGISLTKTDSGDLSELYDREKLFIQRPVNPYSDSSHERCSRHSKQLAKSCVNAIPESSNQKPVSFVPSPIVAKKSLQSLKRASSCSALPSNTLPIDKHNPRLGHDISERTSQKQSNRTDIEEKEYAILQQCYQNEGLSPECKDMACTYVGCQDNTFMSRFPLPDHLNYPLNKYYKSETNIHRLQPLKMIRSSLRKLKNKTQNIHLTTPERYDNFSISSSFEIGSRINSTLDSGYLDSIHEIESSDAILARLGKSPNSKKAWVKKLFKWSVGKSYVAKNKNISPKKENAYSENRVPSSLKKRSNSTRSIPEALMSMWSKVTEPTSATTTVTHEFEFNIPSTLTRANSMPSISINRVTKQRLDDVIYFNEKGPEDEAKKNLFENYFKPIDQPPQMPPSKSEHDDATGVLRHSHHLIENNNIRSSQKPLLYQQSYPVQPTEGHEHCQCCEHSQFMQQTQTQPSTKIFFHPPNHSLQCKNDEDQMVQSVACYTKSDFSVVQPVIAPLDMKISAERRAERRRISEMVFDTFV